MVCGVIDSWRQVVRTDPSPLSSKKNACGNFLQNKKKHGPSSLEPQGSCFHRGSAGRANRNHVFQVPEDEANC